MADNPYAALMGMAGMGMAGMGAAAAALAPLPPATRILKVGWWEIDRSDPGRPRCPPTLFLVSPTTHHHQIFLNS